MDKGWKTMPDGEYIYDVKGLCCKKLRESPDIQIQNSKWYLFGYEPKRKPDTIKYCPFCGKKLKIIEPKYNRYGEPISNNV